MSPPPARQRVDDAREEDQRGKNEQLGGGEVVEHGGSL
jgi:hypothetical protein